MRSVLFTSLFSFICFGLIAGLSQYTNNTENLKLSGQLLRHWAATRPLPSNEVYQAAVTEVFHRSILYDSMLRKDHLLNGMVISRYAQGDPSDECDSLLFSSLRFVAIKKLGFHSEARTAWRAIEHSQAAGHWRRHPRCWDQSTSRDMLIGVIAALTQRPENASQHLSAMFEHIRQNDGYISDGPMYVSYLTPNLARLLRRLARTKNFHYSDMPDIVRRGYSTNEWAVPLLASGYRTHLAALAVWVDLEIEDISGQRLSTQDRLNIEWISYKLVAADPRNLFFRYLRLRATGSLSPAVKMQLLSELSAMEIFPADRLPTNCDRQADYLWQRDSREYSPRTDACDRLFPGVDFLWMAALLLDSGENRTLAH